jgi:5-formyltetrahydrofolate cyclo-ligase
MTSSKSELRAQTRMLRDGLTNSEVAAFSLAIGQRLTATDWYQEAQTVAIFYPLATEVHLLELMKNSEKRFVFPRIVDKKQKQMVFAVLDRGFVPGIFGTSEPDGLMVSPKSIDLILVPGLCFSRQGDRIGYGAGYYDNYLRTYPGHTIGVGYSFQLFDHLPKEDHDVLLDRILTVTEDVCIAR